MWTLDVITAVFAQNTPKRMPLQKWCNSNKNITYAKGHILLYYNIIMQYVFFTILTDIIIKKLFINFLLLTIVLDYE